MVAAGRRGRGRFLGGGRDGRLFNSAAVVDGDGVRAVYRKAHLWDREPEFFTPGDEPPPVVETAAGRIAPLVCFDLFFPEWVRVAALAGAQLLCVCGNWPRGPRPFLLPAPRDWLPQRKLHGCSHDTSEYRHTKSSSGPPALSVACCRLIESSKVCRS